MEMAKPWRLVKGNSLPFDGCRFWHITGECPLCGGTLFSCPEMGEDFKGEIRVFCLKCDYNVDVYADVKGQSFWGCELRVE